MKLFANDRASDFTGSRSSCTKIYAIALISSMFCRNDSDFLESARILAATLFCVSSFDCVVWIVDVSSSKKKAISILLSVFSP